MGATAVITGVLAQLKKLFNVEVPGFEVSTYRALALAALIHRHGGVVDHFQEGNYTLRFAIGALDVGAQGAHAGPVVAESASKFGQQGVLFKRIVNAAQVVRYGREVATGQL